VHVGPQIKRLVCPNKEGHRVHHCRLLNLTACGDTQRGGPHAEEVRRKHTTTLCRDPQIKRPPVTRPCDLPGKTPHATALTVSCFTLDLTFPSLLTLVTPPKNNVTLPHIHTPPCDPPPHVTPHVTPPHVSHLGRRPM
jgi:hypothetical protein